MKSTKLIKLACFVLGVIFSVSTYAMQQNHNVQINLPLNQQQQAQPVPYLDIDKAQLHTLRPYTKHLIRNQQQLDFEGFKDTDTYALLLGARDGNNRAYIRYAKDHIIAKLQFFINQLQDKNGYTFSINKRSVSKEDFLKGLVEVINEYNLSNNTPLIKHADVAQLQKTRRSIIAELIEMIKNAVIDLKPDKNFLLNDNQPIFSNPTSLGLNGTVFSTNKSDFVTIKLFLEVTDKIIKNSLHFND